MASGVVSKALVGLAASRMTPFGLRTRLYRMAGYDVARSARFEQGQRFRYGSITIGEDSYLNAGCMLEPGPSEIVIGDRVFVGPGVVVMAVARTIGPATQRAGTPVLMPVRIGDGTWLGANVVVMPGVTIATGCVIGAGAVVTASTEPDGVYVGTPARRIRDLSAEGDPEPGASSDAL